jgi:hypothetical protein
MPKPPSKPRGPHQTLIQRSRLVSPRDKAEFNNSTGRVVREFIGLTQDDEDVIVGRVRSHLDRVA